MKKLLILGVLLLSVIIVLGCTSSETPDNSEKIELIVTVIDNGNNTYICSNNITVNTKLECAVYESISRGLDVEDIEEVIFDLEVYVTEYANGSLVCSDGRIVTVSTECRSDESLDRPPSILTTPTAPETQKCIDECTSDGCDGTNFIACEKQADGCFKKVNKDIVFGKCDVECKTDGDCSSGDECIDYKCVSYCDKLVPEYIDVTKSSSKPETCVTIFSRYWNDDSTIYPTSKYKTSEDCCKGYKTGQNVNYYYCDTIGALNNKTDDDGNILYQRGYLINLTITDAGELWRDVTTEYILIEGQPGIEFTSTVKKFTVVDYKCIVKTI